MEKISLRKTSSVWLAFDEKKKEISSFFFGRREIGLAEIHGHLIVKIQSEKTKTETISQFPSHFAFADFPRLNRLILP